MGNELLAALVGALVTIVAAIIDKAIGRSAIGTAILISVILASFGGVGWYTFDRYNRVCNYIDMYIKDDPTIDPIFIQRQPPIVKENHKDALDATRGWFKNVSEDCL